MPYHSTVITSFLLGEMLGWGWFPPNLSPQTILSLMVITMNIPFDSRLGRHVHWIATKNNESSSRTWDVMTQYSIKWNLATDYWISLPLSVNNKKHIMRIASKYGLCILNSFGRVGGRIVPIATHIILTPYLSHRIILYTSKSMSSILRMSQG
jgi:hypothetical protein